MAVEVCRLRSEGLTLFVLPALGNGLETQLHGLVWLVERTLRSMHITRMIHARWDTIMLAGALPVALIVILHHSCRLSSIGIYICFTLGCTSNSLDVG